MRFTDPVNYGVISPPVKYAIQQMLTPGWDYVNEYIEYLSLLREQKSVYGFSRAADLENALWTLVEKCLRSNDATCPNLKRFRERFLTIQEHLLLEQYKEEEFLERIGQLEKEIQAHKKTESELEDTYVSDISRLEDEKSRTEEDLKNIRSEKNRLENANKHFMPDLLFIIPDSPRSSEEKLVHEDGHMVDRNQQKFLQKLLNYKKVHHVIWSENLTAKPPARVNDVRPDGEVVIYYVGESNYTAKLKVYPAVTSPDLTHAKYFSLLISRYMDIRNEYMS